MKNRRKEKERQGKNEGIKMRDRQTKSERTKEIKGGPNRATGQLTQVEWRACAVS
jgi:hypothetical protein